ncbi:MAG: hydrogenase iron-sulfur subunit [Chloroflexota bacterium]
MESFEPRIVAFCCTYCAYAAADLAGSMRLRYPANVKIIKMPCTGKIDSLYIMRAFEKGADGVYVAGCREGNCHFLEGNINAKRRVTHLKKLLDELGINGERLEMFNMSAAEGPRFAEVANEMTERVRALGPSPLSAAAQKSSAQSGTTMEAPLKMGLVGASELPREETA